MSFSITSSHLTMQQSLDRFLRRLSVPLQAPMNAVGGGKSFASYPNLHVLAASDLVKITRHAEAVSFSIHFSVTRHAEAVSFSIHFSILSFTAPNDSGSASWPSHNNGLMAFTRQRSASWPSHDDSDLIR